LWRTGFEEAQSGRKDVEEQGRGTFRQASNAGIAVLEEATPPTSRISLCALHRGLRENNLWEGTTRILQVNRIHGSSYQYKYEKIGHGWVQKLVDRHLVPIVDGGELAKKLNEKCQQGA
jgi:hypothetical protein